MKQIQSGFLLGIGSNIEPESNISLVIEALMSEFSCFSLSRILRIPPIGMDSEREFLNLVVFIETTLSKSSLKSWCNSLEIKLGRDRNDPFRSTKDRPADLDILCPITFPVDANRTVNSITDEYFLYPLITELMAFINQKPVELDQKGEQLIVNGLSFGQSATSINSKANSSHKRVI